jgi:hypothetical protein
VEYPAAFCRSKHLLFGFGTTIAFIQDGRISIDNLCHTQTCMVYLPNKAISILQLVPEAANLAKTNY